VIEEPKIPTSETCFDNSNAMNVTLNPASTPDIVAKSPRVDLQFQPDSSGVFPPAVSVPVNTKLSFTLEDCFTQADLLLVSVGRGFGSGWGVGFTPGLGTGSTCGPGFISFIIFFSFLLPDMVPPKLTLTRFTFMFCDFFRFLLPSYFKSILYLGNAYILPQYIALNNIAMCGYRNGE
jgi:hypothetical protein